MQLIDSLSVKHILRKPLDPIENPPLFLMIHGYGSNENDLFAFAQEIPSKFFVISIRGYHSISTNGFAWYDIQISKTGISSDNYQAIESRDKIIHFIKEAILKYKLDPKNVCLCGFSQGAILSYAISLSEPELISKVIALSGFPQEEILPKDRNKDFSSLDFFISHGIYDEIIPISWVQKGLKILEKHNVTHTYKEYKEGHELNQENYKDMLRWIAAR